MSNPYQVLGISPLAGYEEIRSAFRRLAKTYHPDAGSKDPGNSERFHEVTAAYELLRRKAKRSDPVGSAVHASSGTRARKSDAPAPTSQAESETGTPNFSSNTPEPEMAKKHTAFSDLLSPLLSSLKKIGRRALKTTEVDHSYSLSIPFLDAAAGTRRRLTLQNNKSLDVHIPAGVEDGQQIRLRGQGAINLAVREKGDAIVTVSIAPHPIFSREGSDIHIDTSVSLPEAVLGTKLTVPTVDGDVSLRVPAGSNSGTVLRLKGKGLPHPPGKRRLGRGDQYVTLVLVLPPKPDDTLKDFAATWAAGLTHKPRKT